MATVDDHERDQASAEPRVSRLVLLTWFVLVAVPVVLGALTLIGKHWHPSSDNALEVLRIRDVGGRHTPLTGVQSRFGWDHPGPLEFWLLAPFRWVAGDTGILFGVATVNIAALGAVMWLASRRGGARLLAITGVGVLVLEHALGNGFLVDPWNPWIAVLPFFAFVFLAWSVAERDAVMLAPLVGVGSFLVQTHVGYAPLVGGLFVGALVLANVAPRHDSATRWRAPLVTTAAVFVVLWAAPVLQQLFGHPGNLGDIVDYFRHPAEKAIGWTAGYGLFGRELPFAWIRAGDIGPFGLVVPASTLAALALLASVLVAGVMAARRGAAPAARLAGLAVFAALVGIVANARITGFSGPYLLRWWWVLGAILWISLTWSASHLLPMRLSGSVFELSRTPLVVAGVLAIVTMWNAIPTPVPQQTFSNAVARLAQPTASHMSKSARYLVTSVDTRDFGAPVGVGVFVDLDERGYHVYVTRDYAHPFGKWRVAPATGVDHLMTIVGADDLPSYTPPAGGVVVASFDPLNAGERARARDLETAIRARLSPTTTFHLGDLDSRFGRAILTGGGADPRDVDALAALRRRGNAYTVFLSPSR